MMGWRVEGCSVEMATEGETKDRVSTETPQEGAERLRSQSLLRHHFKLTDVHDDGGITEKRLQVFLLKFWSSQNMCAK